MSYVDVMVAAVPTANKEKYLAHSRGVAPLFKEAGATSYREAWGVDVPDGKVTDMKRAVQAKADETVVVGYITWPDRAARDAAWEKLMKDSRMAGQEMPFDGSRMIFGGFDLALDL